MGQVYYERVNSYVASDVYDFQSAGVRDVSRRLVDLENTRAAETDELIEMPFEGDRLVWAQATIVLGGRWGYLGERGNFQAQGGQL